MAKYGELRADLTPLDLFVAGYAIRRHCNGTSWCHWRKNPYGEGNIYSAPRATVEEACTDARWLMSGHKQTAYVQMPLLATA